jgi:hypothetical protein
MLKFQKELLLLTITIRMGIRCMTHNMLPCLLQKRDMKAPNPSKKIKAKTLKNHPTSIQCTILGAIILIICLLPLLPNRAKLNIIPILKQEPITHYPLQAKAAAQILIIHMSEALASTSTSQCTCALLLPTLPYKARTTLYLPLDILCRLHRW